MAMAWLIFYAANALFLLPAYAETTSDGPLSRLLWLFSKCSGIYWDVEEGDEEGREIEREAVKERAQRPLLETARIIETFRRRIFSLSLVVRIVNRSIKV